MVMNVEKIEGCSVDKEQALKQKTVLYVEDDEITVEFMQRAILRYVNQVHVAYNGEEGLKKYQELKPDIVITDIEMPIMNGLSMMKKIRELDSEVPIVILTAFEDEAHIGTELATSALIKPINRTKLKEALFSLS